MTADAILGTMLISFGISIVSCIAGVKQVKVVRECLKYFKSHGTDLSDSNLEKNGYRIAMFSFVISAFFFYRIFFIASTGSDFSAKDWLVYDITISVYALFAASYVRTMLNEFKKLTGRIKKN